jgi:hypothetical protein
MRVTSLLALFFLRITVRVLLVDKVCKANVKSLRPYNSKRFFRIKLKILADRKLGWGFKG